MKGKSYMRAQNRGNSVFAKMMTIVALMLFVSTGAWADITITWGSAELSSLTDDQLLAGATKTVNGITVTVNAGTNNFLRVSSAGAMFSATNDNAFTFSTELGNFTKIECTSVYLSGTLGNGWDGATWTGDANSVNMSNAGSILAVSSITFTIGEPEPVGYAVSLKAETADEGNWQGKAGEGKYQSLPLTGLEAGTTVTLKYSGERDVKSVKAVKKAKPAATVTTAPMAKTGVKAGEDVAIVNEGAAEGGTMMYMVNATQPASTDGFSATVPTAEGLTAGTYYVWYYVKADDSHSDSEISATGIEVTIEVVDETGD